MRSLELEGHCRIKELAENGVGAVAILAPVDSKNSFLQAVWREHPALGLSCLHLSGPQAPRLLRLPSLLPDSTNDIQLIQQNLVDAKPLGWRQCFPDCRGSSWTVSNGLRV